MSMGLARAMKLCDRAADGRASKRAKRAQFGNGRLYVARTVLIGVVGLVLSILRDGPGTRRPKWIS